MTRPADALDQDEPQLLDPDTWDMPRRLTRREGAMSTGPDWIWTQPHFEEDDTHD